MILCVVFLLIPFFAIIWNNRSVIGCYLYFVVNQY